MKRGFKRKNLSSSSWSFSIKSLPTLFFFSKRYFIQTIALKKPDGRNYRQHLWRGKLDKPKLEKELKLSVLKPCKESKMPKHIEDSFIQLAFKNITLIIDILWEKNQTGVSPKFHLFISRKEVIN